MNIVPTDRPLPPYMHITPIIINYHYSCLPPVRDSIDVLDSLAYVTAQSTRGASALFRVSALVKQLVARGQISMLLIFDLILQ